MARPAEERSDDKYGLDRIVFFSDAVMAIAITLLVITIDVPVIEPDKVDTELAGQVIAMWPQYLGFAVSFWVIGRYWVAHHHVFRYIVDYDAGLISINTLFLMFIAFMPFATSLLFTYPAQFFTVAIYAGLIGAIGLTLFWMWTHATRNHRLVNPNLSESTIRSGARRMLVAPAAFLASIGIAAFNPQWAMYSWIILPPLLGWVWRRQSQDG